MQRPSPGLAVSSPEVADSSNRPRLKLSDRRPAGQHGTVSLMADDFSLLLRGAALTLAAVLACATLRMPGRARWTLLPLLVCLAAYLVRSAPQWGGAPSSPILPPLTVGALLFPAAFWWMVHGAFADRTDVPPAVVAGVPLLIVAGLWPSGSAGLAQWAPAAQKLIGAAFLGAALWRLWSTSRGDLVTQRRRWRGWLLAYTGMHALAVLSVELWLQDAHAPAWLDSINVAVIAAVLFAAAALLIRPDEVATEVLFGREGASMPSDAQMHDAAGRQPPSSRSGVQPDRPWLARMQELMEKEHAYRDPELSIANLAQRIGLPEYRLRELIHEQLGYRNFPAFVNDWRLQEVQRRLDDPALDRRPILTLALEAGFGSIGPFNRAFRERFGVTPTAYRRDRSAGKPGAARTTMDAGSGI